MARGDRRVGQALLEAHRLGCRLDGWDEYFDYEKWLEAFRRAGLDLDFYTTRGFAAELPHALQRLRCADAERKEAVR